MINSIDTIVSNSNIITDKQQWSDKQDCRYKITYAVRSLFEEKINKQLNSLSPVISLGRENCTLGTKG